MSELKNTENQAPSPFIAVVALLLLLVGGAGAFFVFGGKLPASSPTRGEAGHVHGPDCAHGHVHDENCDREHDEAGHVHGPDCAHGHVHDENCDHERAADPEAAAQPASEAPVEPDV